MPTERDQSDDRIDDDGKLVLAAFEGWLLAMPKRNGAVAGDP